jgi:hypothetical protein
VHAKFAGRAPDQANAAAYFNLTEQGVVVLVMMYAKADQANVAPGEIGKAV